MEKRKENLRLRSVRRWRRSREEEEERMGYVLRVRFASFFAGAAVASAMGLYLLRDDYKAAHRSISQQVFFFIIPFFHFYSAPSLRTKLSRSNLRLSNKKIAFGFTDLSYDANPTSLDWVSISLILWSESIRRDWFWKIPFSPFHDGFSLQTLFGWGFFGVSGVLMLCKALGSFLWYPLPHWSLLWWSWEYKGLC